LRNIANIPATGNQHPTQQMKNVSTINSTDASSINASKALTEGSNSGFKIDKKNTVDFLLNRLLVNQDSTRIFEFCKGSNRIFG
jgi:hypothetical protein